MSIQKNVAGQKIYRVLVASADGSAITTGATIAINGTTGGGTLTHKGGGLWEYLLTQAETNYDSFGFVFGGTGVIPVGGCVVTQDYPRNAIPAVQAGNSGGLPLAGTGGKVPATIASGDDVDGAAVKATIGEAGAGLTAVGDTAGTTSLLARLTSTRAGYLDNLAVAPLTTLGANAPAGWINAAAVSGGALNGKGDWSLAASTPSWYTGPPTTFSIATATAAAILATPANLLATDSSGRVTTANPGGDATAAEQATIAAAVDAVKTQTDKLTFDASNNLKSAVQAIADGVIKSSTFTVSTLTGVASGILEKIDACWRVFYKPSKKDDTAKTVKYFADDGTTPLATVPYTDDGSGNQTRGAAS